MSPGRERPLGDAVNENVLSLPCVSKITNVPYENLSSSLADFFVAETLQPGEEVDDSHDEGLPRPSAVQWTILDLPRCLILHLKRWDATGQKNAHKIHVPDVLLLPDPFSLEGGSISYALRAMVLHHGQTVHRGHYTAHCLRRDQWWHFNDTSVVLHTTAFDRANPDIYLVFYDRQQHAP